MKMKIITISFILIGVFAAIILSGGLVSSDYHITTTIDNAEIDGNTLYINGHSNLPDGAVAEISVKPGEMEPATSSYNFDKAEATVSDGQWSSSHDITDYPGRVVAIEFAVSNMMGLQPENVTKALGDEGQRINNEDLFIGENEYDGFYIYDYTQEITLQE